MGFLGRKKGQQAQSESKKTWGKKAFIGGAILALAVIAGLVVVLLTRPEQEPTIYISYGKGGIVYLTQNPQESETSIFKTGISSTWTAGQTLSYKDPLERFVAVRENGKRIFFVGGDNDSKTLYCWDLDNPFGPAKVAENPWMYAVSQDGSKILYIDTNDRLYSSDLKKRQRIATDVWDLYASADLEVFYWEVMTSWEDWRDSESTLHANNAHGGEQLATYDKVFPQFSPDMKTVYFCQDGVLYKKETGREKVRISTECVDIVGTWAAGELYYLTGDSYGENMTLCHYNGEESTQLLTGVSKIDVESQEDAAVGVISLRCNGQDLWYAVIDGRLQQLKAKQIQKVVASPDGSMLAYEVISGAEEMAVYTVPIRDGRLGEPQKIDTAIQAATVRFLENGTLCYYKETGRLYMDGVLVDTNVLDWKWEFSNSYWAPPPPSESAVTYCEGTGLTVYYCDWDSDTWSGTLKAFDGEKVVVIDQDVFDYQISNTGEIYYLRNYDTEHFTGQLYVYNGEGTKRIDDGVVALLSGDGFDKTAHGEYW